MKKLLTGFYVSSDQKVLLGLLGGISHKFGFNPLVLRIIAVMAVILFFPILIGGLCVAVYFIGLVLPAEPTLNVPRPLPNPPNLKRQHSTLGTYHIICWILFIIAIITCTVATIDFFDLPRRVREEYLWYLGVVYFYLIFLFFHAIFVGIVKNYIIRNPDSPIK